MYREKKRAESKTQCTTVCVCVCKVFFFFFGIIGFFKLFCTNIRTFSSAAVKLTKFDSSTPKVL